MRMKAASVWSFGTAFHEKQNYQKSQKIITTFKDIQNRWAVQFAVFIQKKNKERNGKIFTFFSKKKSKFNWKAEKSLSYFNIAANMNRYVIQIIFRLTVILKNRC